MSKKDIIKTFGAGLTVGALFGLKVCIDIYDVGYKDGMKASDGNKSAQRFHEALLEGKAMINKKLAKK